MDIGTLLQSVALAVSGAGSSRQEAAVVDKAWP